MGKWGYCNFKQRDHQLSDFHSREMFYVKTNPQASARSNPGMHTEMCRFCGKRPNE
jgi:hypothetical protein